MSQQPGTGRPQGLPEAPNGLTLPSMLPRRVAGPSSIPGPPPQASTMQVAGGSQQQATSTAAATVPNRPGAQGHAQPLRSEAPTFGIADQPSSRPSALDASSSADPFSGQQMPQYGLVEELVKNAGHYNPLAVRLKTNHDPAGALTHRLHAAARRTPAAAGGPPAAIAATPPSKAAVTAALYNLATGQQPAEPDYGLVAELRQGSTTQPPSDGHGSAFGLAAEVARRRARPDVFPPRSSTNAGGGLSARPRKRLAAVGGPADFGLAEQMAAKAAQDELDRLDPFNSANRSSRTDPFQTADQLIKFPILPFQPAQLHDQEVPQGVVPLLVPSSGPSQTSAVSKDDGEYGLAEQLGVDPDEARRRRAVLMGLSIAQPPNLGPLLGYDEHGQPILAPGGQTDFQEPAVPMKYAYDPTTGMLVPPEGVAGEGGKELREYMEDAATGHFYRINQEGLWRRMMLRVRRRLRREQAEQEGMEAWDPDAGTFRGKLRTMVSGVSATFSLLGLFVQGLMGGFALLNFVMTYFLYSHDGLRDWLKYYSPLSLAANRIYYTLVAMSVVASAARLAQDQLRDFAPRAAGLLLADSCQLTLYCVAYVATVLCTPLDDELTYEWDRNNAFYRLTFSSEFKKRLSLWHTLNLVRTICIGIAWLLCAHQNSAFVRNTMVQHKVRLELQRLTQPHTRSSPVNVMADTPPSGSPAGQGQRSAGKGVCEQPQQCSSSPAGHFTKGAESPTKTRRSPRARPSMRMAGRVASSAGGVDAARVPDQAGVLKGPGRLQGSGGIGRGSVRKWLTGAQAQPAGQPAHETTSVTWQDRPDRDQAAQPVGASNAQSQSGPSHSGVHIAQSTATSQLPPAAALSQQQQQQATAGQPANRSAGSGNMPGMALGGMPSSGSTAAAAAAGGPMQAAAGNRAGPQVQAMAPAGRPTDLNQNARLPS